jgi:hypothetical protein
MSASYNKAFDESRGLFTSPAVHRLLEQRVKDRIVDEKRHHSTPAIGNLRIRTRTSSNTATAPFSRYSAMLDRFARSSQTWVSGLRPAARRNRITDGLLLLR